MKVAIVSPVPLFPVNAGNRSRILNLARAVRSLGCDVHFVYLESRQTGGMDLDAHRDEFGADHVQVLHRTGVALACYRFKRVAWLVRRLAAQAVGSRHAYYTGLDELFSDSFLSQLRALQRRHAFDAVFVEYVFYSRALDAFPDTVVKVLDTHDIFADRHVPFIGRAGAKRYMFSIPPERECEGLRRAHVALAIQADEGDALAARLGSDGAPSVAVLSHLLAFPPQVDCASHADATFVGSDNQPNRDAMQYFVDEILPHVVARLPAFRVHLAGTIAAAVPDGAHVVKRGPVVELGDAFACAPISINPMLLGTGINIKLLESMALGVPTVSTQTGARGLGEHAAGGVTIVPDADPRGFADALVRLATDRAHRVAQGAAARDAARAWHDAQLRVLRETLAHRACARALAPSTIQRKPDMSKLADLKQRLRVWLYVKRLTAQWRREAARCVARDDAAAGAHLLILPCDPWTLVGSKGDEAMLSAVVERLRAANRALQVSVVTATPQAAHAATRMGFHAVDAWREPWRLTDTVERLAALRPSALVVIGADVMDGYYSPMTSLRLLATADLLVRRGVRGTILGFSFNARPYRPLRHAFDRLDARLLVNVRDDVSLDRFRRFSSAPATLVADSAFMLAPDHASDSVRDTAAWIDARRAAGDVVIAFNLHPMLIRGASDADIAALVAAAQHALRAIAAQRGLGIVLLSHDYRGRDGDDTCLEPLHRALAAALGERLCYPRARMSAAELKAIAGQVDGVVTGRMHLAIASLGMGVPVAALTYQDKFQGLFRHFGLSDAFLLKPADAMRATRLAAVLERFVSALPQLREQVRAALPRVKDASLRNLRGVIDEIDAIDAIEPSCAAALPVGLHSKPRTSTGARSPQPVEFSRNA
ncbi:TPA: polysaccharide pyruvyl transferase family protein [Burkholderia vietnamiensis]|uniref:polysaccharide pyruvyl transferase family protein n=1 Tax=Burkholderia TaxID=32008 RepID=UPI0005567B29|nr:MULTISPECIES: polysaccharide pyruvyl transferase family protein [Burkholderia]MBR7910222.1 polysaccharide pyruvyl transferase family protein [Burkholderia vietnamiensis]SCZ43208.1 Polysaccharide pyruvyl transferase family protein WcaK [Burkholderia vietnamiensis]SFY32390.1 Polysaccharide pyruvyl transferase family protein WcaK [Burkholderia vietnamiensis]HDR9275796.1 polysaccharide pyruvyl transferase family protein [Burkholderia vietnamiensis]